MMEHLTALNTDAIDISLQMVERADVYGHLCQSLRLRSDGYEISIHDLRDTKDFETGPNAEKLKILKDRIGKARVVAATILAHPTLLGRASARRTSGSAHQFR
jgi:hypothetical protein